MTRKTKFAFKIAVACLLSASASAFAPPAALFSTEHTMTNPIQIDLVDRRLLTIALQISPDDAVEAYGGGGRFGFKEMPSSTSMDVDMEMFMDVDVDGNDATASCADGSSQKQKMGDTVGDTTMDTSTKANRFELPEVSRRPPLFLSGWRRHLLADRLEDFGVDLVTQCTFDRLSNLKAQLSSWKGRASVAVYIKASEDIKQAKLDILSTIDEIERAGKNIDVTVTLVKGYKEGEPYPINYLRNLALLAAQRQHLRYSPTLDNSALLLVDVDFRPSSNLYDMLHTKDAADSIMKEGKVVVCPAFECTKDTCPSSISELKELIDKGEAEGFHQTQFPRGHGPTQFDKFLEISLHSPTTGRDINEKDYFWNEIFKIEHEDMFEPYIVMASGDVPLYDERFQGYGLNKISHLASVAGAKGGEYLVLPGAFLVAPTHERSESWEWIYGNPGSDENKRNQSALRDLYADFLENLKEGRPPVVSKRTSLMQRRTGKNGKEPSSRDRLWDIFLQMLGSVLADKNL